MSVVLVFVGVLLMAAGVIRGLTHDDSDGPPTRVLGLWSSAANYFAPRRRWLWGGFLLLFPVLARDLRDRRGTDDVGWMLAVGGVLLLACVAMAAITDESDGDLPAAHPLAIFGWSLLAVVAIGAAYLI